LSTVSDFEENCYYRSMSSIEKPDEENKKIKIKINGNQTIVA